MRELYNFNSLAMRRSEITAKFVLSAKVYLNANLELSFHISMECSSALLMILGACSKQFRLVVAVL